MSNDTNTEGNLFTICHKVATSTLERGKSLTSMAKAEAPDFTTIRHKNISYSREKLLCRVNSMYI